MRLECVARVERMERERIGKYEIVAELGRGTMGEVYRARDPVLNRFVALKTLEVRGSPGDEALDRFKREAQAAALLNHPNIVTVHDFGEENGLLYMAMELLEGTDLRDAIDHELLKTTDERLDVLDGVLAALDYAHSKGVVHRDVKPANIHLGPGRQVKIMDFGLARVSTSAEMTQEGIVLGTPNYMSPEQALGDRVDGRSDLFSTGAVLYELLTGHKPFEADSTPSVLFQVVHRQPPPVRRWAPKVPTGIVAVVNRALEKDREKRFPFAGDMRAAIAIARQTVAPPAAAKAPPLPPARPARPEPPPLPPTAAPTLPRGTYDAAAPPVPPRPRIPTPQSMPSPPELRASLPTPPSGPTPSVGRSVWLLPMAGAGAAVLVLAVAAVGLWLRGRPAPARAPSPSATSAAVSALTQELVRKQVQLARRELENKSYTAAAAEAEGALKLAPGDADAAAVLATTRERVRELNQSIAESRRLLGAGDTVSASRELSRVLELDPRHPAAAELSARLNSVFRAQADEAAASTRQARSAALAAGVTAWSLRSVDAGVSQAELLLARQEFADATRTFLEARDAFDRSRREALQLGAPTSAPAPPSPAPSTAELPTPAAPTPAAVPKPAAVAEGTPPPAVEPAATPPAGRGFAAEATSVATPSAGGVLGFDSSGVSSRRPPQFVGRMEFEVLPPTVRPGEPFVVRIHLRNDGRRTVKIRGVSVAVVVSGQRSPAPVTPLQSEVPAQSRALVAEYSGVWAETPSWTLEVVVTADRNETVTSRLRAN